MSVLVFTHPDMVRHHNGHGHPERPERLAAVLEALAPLRRLGTVARDGESLDEVDLAVPVALVLGNEAHGLTEDVASLLDGRVTIPMVGRSESLNVGMAAAVLCFETARQRRRG